MGQIRRRFLVSGVVQGVGFRYWTQREAERLGVAGHAKNLLDGRVEVEAEGSPAAVGELEAWLRAGGPSSARVSAVEVGERETTGAAGFVTA